MAIVLQIVSILTFTTLLSTKPASAAQQNVRDQVSETALLDVNRRYGELQPEWFKRFLITGNCDHLGQRHPDWNTCMSGIAAWMNRKQAPQLFGSVNDMHLSLLDNLSAAVVGADVNLQGGTATVTVQVAGVCKFTDEFNSCSNTPEMPKRNFITKVRVNLTATGTPNKQWGVVSADEDPQAALSRKQAFAADVSRIGQAAQKKQNQFALNQQLIQAVNDRNHAAAERALDQGADPNVTLDKSGMRNRTRMLFLSNESSLHLAIWREDVAMVKLLLERGANPNQRGAFNTNAGEGIDFTPLRQVIYSRANQEMKLSLISLLIAKGADPKLDGALQSVEQWARDGRTNQVTRNSYNQLTVAAKNWAILSERTGPPM